MAEELPVVETKRLDHLGLIAGFCKKIDLEKQLNLLLPKTRGDVKLTSGEAILAMILNGLGFRERRLYLTAHFYKDKATEQLFGNKFNINNLNDDVLGRALDAIYQYGPSKLFTDIAFKTAWDLV